MLVRLDPRGGTVVREGFAQYTSLLLEMETEACSSMLPAHGRELS